VIALSDGTGAVTTINKYDEYGKPQGTNVGRFQYTGQVWLGEIGAYYYKARIYSPVMGGRFLQTDPIGTGGGINLYAYVGNDPIGHSDPSGLLAQYCTGSILPTYDNCASVGFLSVNGQDTQAAAMVRRSAISDALPGISSAALNQIMSCLNNPTPQCMNAELLGSNGLSTPGYGNEPLHFNPLTSSEQVLMDRLLSTPEFKFRAAYAWNQTAVTGLEHGFFIWLNPSGSFTLGKVWTGNSGGMGWKWDRYAQTGAGNFWATFHTHPGWWEAASGPSGFYTSNGILWDGDLHFNQIHDAIGIIGSRWGVPSSYGH